jgi:streptogramin lyase
MILKRLRTRFGIPVALMAVLALALPAGASADALGSNAEFPGSPELSFPFKLVEGSDGNMWFTDPASPFTFSGKVIGKVTPGGVVTQYSPGLTGGAFGIADGPDNNVWFTEKKAKKIGYIKPSEPETSLKEFPEVGTLPGEPTYITAGPDGNLWFIARFVEGEEEIESFKLGRITPVGVVTEFSAGLNAGAEPCALTAGPDGNVWFGDCNGLKPSVGKITPAGTITEYEIKGGAGENHAESIALGSDGRLWFSAANAADERLGALDPAKENKITYYKTPTSPTSFTLTSLTAGPDGNIWGMEPSSENETQKVGITATGGTYKLGFEGKETGWTGSGNISGFTATGDVKRYTSTTCKRTSGSKELTECAEGGSEVGMRISGTGIPLKTTIEKIEGKKIFLTAAATSGTGTATTVTAGWIKNVTISTGKAEVGQQVAGTGLTTSEIIAVGELEGKVTITPATAPTAAGTSIALTGGLKEIKSVTTSTGTPSKGEQVSGAGIPAGTTITACTPSTCESPTSLAISNFPTEAATGVSLSADLRFDAIGSAVEEALAKLSTVGTGNVTVTPTGSNRLIGFTGKFARSNVPLATCDASKLTGGTCTVETTVDSYTNRLFRIIPATGELKPEKGFSLKPATLLQSFQRGGNSLAAGPGGTVWYTSIGTPTAIGKFGTEPQPTLKVVLEGSGGGTVVSNPAGIECKPTCEAEYPEGTKVTLTASPDSESLFTSWKGCETGGANGRECKVTVKGPVTTVTAKFTRAYDVTVNRVGSGLGKVGSSPGGVLCLSNCSSTSAKFKELTNVTLTATPSKHFTFTEWTGDCSGSGTCSLSSLSADKEVGAKFTVVPQFDLTVTKAGGGQGTVKAKQAGINCGATCSSMAAAYYQGEVIELLVPVPGKGSKFAGWSGSGCSGTGTCLVTMSSAKSVEAKFE